MLRLKTLLAALGIAGAAVTTPYVARQIVVISPPPVMPGVSTPIPGNNLYVRDGATGTFATTACDGWASDRACDTIPAMSSITRGDTIWVAEGSYTFPTFNKAESGTSLITVKRAIAGAHGTSSGWFDSYGDGQALVTGPLATNTSYWLFDGQVGTEDDPTTYGFRIATPSNCNQANRMWTMPLGQSAPVHYVTIRKWAVLNCGSSYDFTQVALYWNPTSSSPNTGITIEDNLLGNSQNGILIRHGEQITIVRNWFVDGWSSASNHGEAISPGNLDDSTIAYNVFKNISGSGVISFHRVSAGATAEENNSDNNDIYGNILIGGTLGGNGSIGLGDSSYPDIITNLRVYHNTIANFTGSNTGIYFIGSGGDVCAAGHTAYNNLFVGNANPIVACTHDYNAFFGNTGTVAAETNRQDGVGDPLVDSANDNFHLVSQTSLGTVLGFPYNVDPAGVTRTGPSRGAYEYVP